MMKGSIHQDDIAVLMGMHQTTELWNTSSKIWYNLKGGINNSGNYIEVLQQPLSATDRNTRQKISKETENLNNIINQQDDVDIYTNSTQQ